MVQSQWNYSPTAAKFCYDKAFDLVKSAICEVFAGPAKHGIHSASLQKTPYDTERLVLERVPQVRRQPRREAPHRQRPGLGTRAGRPQSDRYARKPAAQPARMPTGEGWTIEAPEPPT